MTLQIDSAAVGITREPIDWDNAGEFHNFDAVREGDIVWPCLGRPGDWPCTVLKKSCEIRAMLVEASFDGMERWHMRPVFLILDDELSVEAGCQDRELMFWRLENCDW